MRYRRVGSLILAVACGVVLLTACGRGAASGEAALQGVVESAVTVVTSPTAILPTQTAVPVTATTAATSTPRPQPSPTPTAALPTVTATDVPTKPPPPTATPDPEPPTGVFASPVRLVIPDLEIDARVIPMGWRIVDSAGGQVSEWVIPEDEAGHHLNSAGLGQNGNLVISGHNNIYGRVFENISRAWDDDARIQVDKATDRSEALSGDLLQLFDADGRSYDYQIEEFYRLRDTGVSVEQRIQNARFMQATDDQRVTLITCWPPWNNTHRLVVVARPVSAQP